MMNIILILLINSINGQLNLYISSTSTQALFDLDNYQLYYVNQNYVRQSAIENTLLVSSDIDIIEFHWNDDRSNIQMNYEYNSSSTDERDLLKPVLNIDSKGIVPQDISSFYIYFPCLSISHVNCSVLFRFYNSTKNHSSTMINLKFLKFCQNQPINYSLMKTFYNSNQLDEYLRIRRFRQDNFSTITFTTVLSYTLIIALVVFLVVFSTTMSLFCLYRMTIRKKKHLSDNLIDNIQDHPTLPTSFDVTTLEDVSLYSCTQYDFIKNADEILSSTIFSDSILDPNRVTLNEIILTGKFSHLIRCSYNDLTTNTSTQLFYGKTVNSSATITQINQMLQDCCSFVKLKHSNINSPIGIVYKVELSPYPLIVYPYSTKGILKRFIIRNRTSHREKLLSTQELVYMAIHIAKGLHFLHKRKMLMKDIGTRNCLVMDDLTVKLTDCALSRDLFPQDYDCLPTDIPTDLRPLKFMAIESIKERRFSTASDVWSYGVLLWELMSCGLQPYNDIESCDLIMHLENNYRLVQPTNCPDSLFKIMCTCWINAIDQRPSMTSILHSLIDFYGQLSRFI